jgi:hypothetical protein
MRNVGRVGRVGVVVALLLFASGCCTYDEQLHQKLLDVRTELIGKVAAEGQPAQKGLYDRLSDNDLPENLPQAQADVDELVKIADANKKLWCPEPPKQMRKIQDKFARDIDARKEGPLKKTSVQERKENMQVFINVGIETQERINHK